MIRPAKLFTPLAVALLVLASGCQMSDSSVPTESEREVALSGANYVQIQEMIIDLFPRNIRKFPANEFLKIARLLHRGQTAEGEARTEALIDHILAQHAAGLLNDVSPSTEDAVAELVLALAQFAALAPDIPPVEGGLVLCTPGVDCEETTIQEQAGVAIPGELITEPFVLYMVRLPNDFAQPPLFPFFYEIHTIPEGITFPPASVGGSLSLSVADDGPAAGLCTLDSEDPVGTPADAIPGENLFLAHQVNGVWEQLPYVDPPFLDCEGASSEISALWSSPIGLALSPVIDLLSPSRAYAGGKRTGGAITSFSPFGSEYTGDVPTTSSLSVVGGPSLNPGDPITFHVLVAPTPPDDVVGILILTEPIFAAGATSAELIAGAAETTLVCGDNHLQVGHTYTATAVYRGAEGFAQSESTEEITFSCLAAEE